IVFLEKKLEPTGETEIAVSDSEFPKINFDYDIVVRLFTSDNEVISETKRMKYYYESESFDIQLIADSLQFSFRKNGISADREVTIFANDNFGNSTQVFDGNVPCKIAINPYYASYTVQSGSLSKTINISSQ